MTEVSNRCVPIVTISVPVYNVEKYLAKCLENLINQSLQDIEIILVDDGSTDNSGRICDEFAQIDKRIVVIHKENGGLASARQAALDIASGVYFCACDADDWAELSMYEKMYRRAVETNADVVICDYVSEYGDGMAKFSRYGKEIPQENNLIIDEVLNGSFPCSVWSKMFRRDIFERYNLSWEPGINMGEDFLITLKVLQHPLRFAYLSESLYHYRRMPGEDSYTNRVTLSSYNQMVRIQDWIESNFVRSRYVRGINHYLINIAFAGLRVEEGMTPGHYRKSSVDRLGYADLFLEHSLKSLVVLWTKVFGYYAGRGIYKLMYKIVYK